ncbi:amidase family protein [Nocardioides sp. AE5]|uniref:amidase n=1 Tax=Nocardioides sp. AE5 TaxID=2962573 RepID=UPI002881B769|nr:amidase family protein [Nocardioides sp. AE5]MDT0203123.1 amidase family protein [Nocardioides sp. AE5]
MSQADAVDRGRIDTSGAPSLPETDAVGMAELVRSGEVGARELVETAIARIEALNPTLNAVVNERFEQALAEVDAGLPEGPLRGVPVLVKDLSMPVAGLPATNGSRLFADAIAPVDGELVARYKRAGMVVLGTTNSPEFGLNASTEPLLHGPTRNPRDLARSPGGSSGGSAAAVAAGMVPVAHASDGGGSIRIPASMNGLFGLKPSRGRVTPAPAPSVLAAPASVHHAVTTTVRDSAVLLDIASPVVPGTVIGIPAPATSFLDAAMTAPQALRIGVPDAFADLATDPQVQAALDDAVALCASLGHVVEPMPTPFDRSLAAVANAPLMGVAFAVAIQDRLAALGRDLAEDDLEPFSRVLFGHYAQLPASDLVRGLQAVQQLGWQIGAHFTQYDVMVMPTLAMRVPALGVLDTSDVEGMYQRAGDFAAWTSAFNTTGMPGMSVPLGTDADGLPIGVQFVAQMGQEDLLLSLAGQLEAAAPWQRHL